MNKTIKFFQKVVFHARNSYEPTASSQKITLNDGRLLIKNICYGKQYPNSFLDVYLSPAENTIHPTFIYVHGGGYTWGTKDDYKPTSPDHGLGVFFNGLNNLGFHIVSINYAYAPEYTYPTPIIQISQAVEFLKSNSELGLNLNCVAFGGDSAGGQLIGQLINIQTNKKYAKDLNIPPVLSSESIKAAVFFSGLLDLERFGVTYNKVTDRLFSKCGYAYFNTNALPKNPQCIQASILNHATVDFPPCFISDGNHGTFFEQAGDFSKKLNELGVANELILHPKSTARLAHGYEVADSPQACETKRLALEFLRKHC